MKNYNRPELSISLFDVEDVITKSGLPGVLTQGYNNAEKDYGTLYTDQDLSQPASTNDKVVYFSWN